MTAPARGFRPPAVPLITIDPYTSCWSMTDRLFDDWSRHWTGTKFPLFAVLRVDGRSYRVAGGPEWAIETAEQMNVTVAPTRTIYRFACGPVELSLVFTTPLLLDDLELLARPVGYVDAVARSLDGAPHDVALYLDITGAWAVNLPHEKVIWQQRRLDGLAVLSMRSVDQPILAKAGDDLRIDWGTIFLAVPMVQGEALVGDIDFCRDGFIRAGGLADTNLLPMPRKTTYWGEAVLAVRLGLDCSGEDAGRSHAIVAYDDEYSAEYFGTWLRPWWRRGGADADAMLRAAAREHDEVVEQCRAFDESVLEAAEQVGGVEYAALLGLVYRQAVSAHKLAVSPDGRPFFFSKENFSNACMATVDVTFPSCPVFALYNPDVLKAMLEPVFDYAASERWPHPFPPHDIGTYPKGNGQVYRNFHKPESTDPLDSQMPIEEAGNMLIMAAAIAAREGSADYAARHWPQLSQWAAYLEEFGLDPESQLCTDDFGGMVPHSANLSVKAIVGLGAYAQLARMQGDAPTAQRYAAVAGRYAAEWQRLADDTGHSRLAFDQAGTWSLKYNMVWDALLDLRLFPRDLVARELAWYETRRMRYGIPLDSRGNAAKPEWQMWIATMSDDPDQFRRIVQDVHRYVNETPSRVPVSDLYLADSGRQRGWQARSVVGGFFMPLLKAAMRESDRSIG